MKKMSRKILTNARSLRRKQTLVEEQFWKRVRNRSLGGYKFRRQKPMGKYILDFYCPEKKLAIEFDGGGHALDSQMKYDIDRTEYFKQHGIAVLRFWNNQFTDYPDAVMEEIWETLNNR